MGLESIVNVLITKGSKQVAQAGFGIPLILGQHTRFLNSDVVRQYSSTAAMLSDGFLTSDAEYKAALALMSQDKKPTKFLVGKRTAVVAQVSTITPTVLNSTTYVLTLNGVQFSFTSGGSATASQIVAGLLALVNGGQSAVVASGTTTLILTAAVPGDGFSVLGDANLAVVATTANHGASDDIQAVMNVNKTWYCLILTSRTAADILNAAAWIEANMRMFLACSSDAGVLTTGTTDIAAKLKALSYVRTAYVWSAGQAAYPEAAWAGRVLPDDPGSETWKFKTLAGQVADDQLTDSQIANAQGKNANLYVTIASVPIMEEGVMAFGEFIDVTRFNDWVQARIKEGIFSRLVNSEKVPYTDPGVGILESEIHTVLLNGVGVGGIAKDPEFTVSAPKVADMPQQSRAARTVPGISFSYTLAGAVHAVDPINGFVSV